MKCYSLLEKPAEWACTCRLCVCFVFGCALCLLCPSVCVHVCVIIVRMITQEGLGVATPNLSVDWSWDPQKPKLFLDLLC